MEKIIYDSKKRLLHKNMLLYNEGIYRIPKTLGEKQGKLLMFLSDNEIHLYDDIYKFIYNNGDSLRNEGNKNINKTKIRTLVSKLKKRISNFKEIEIKSRNGIGYYMKGDIYIQ